MSPGGPRRAAVLGHPVAHSLSPTLHRAAHRALGLADWTYERHDVTADQLPAFVRALDATWAGLSLTMPLKHAVLPLLDDVEGLAAAVGAVNTVLVQQVGEGRLLVGANTDVAGIVAALREATGPVLPEGSGVILGAGATAASALAALAELGHPRAVVVARSLARAGEVLRASSRMGLEPTLVRWDRAADLLPAAGVVISTVPAGACDGLAADLAARRAGLPGVLLDVVYAPWPTDLAAAWTGPVAPGWSMLLHQAAEQVRLMTGQDAPVEAMRSALLDALRARAVVD